LHRGHCLIPYYPEGSNPHPSTTRIYQIDHPSSVLINTATSPLDTFCDFSTSSALLNIPVTKHQNQPIMPSQTPTPIALPVPRRRLSPLLTNTSFGQDVTLCLANTLNSKTKSPYTPDENDYAPPAPPPPSPVNFPSESWSTACGIRH